MAITDPANRLAHRSDARAQGPRVVFAAVILIAFAGSTVSTTILPRDLVLPAVSTLFFVLAAAVALVGWACRQASERAPLTYWDVAGVLTFVGIFAAALIEPDQLVRLVEGAHRDN